jgi:hypothetical protein
LLFLKTDVIGVITAISRTSSTQTSMKQTESVKRTVTIHLPRLTAYILLDSILLGQFLNFKSHISAR